MNPFHFFNIRKLKQQVSDMQAAIGRNQARLDVVVQFKGQDSLEARQLAQRIKFDGDEVDRLERKIKNGGY